MPLQERDKKALLGMAVALALFAVLRFGVFPVWDRWEEQRVSLPIQEATLRKYREAVEATELRQQEVESLERRLEEAEKGLLSSQTPALASAELQELVKQLTSAHSIEVSSSEFLAAKPLDDGYTQIPLGLQFSCRLDQLVNFLQAIPENGKYLTVSRLAIQPTGSRERLLNVSMTVAGLMRAAGSAEQSSP